MGIEYGTFHQILCNSDILTMVNFKSVYSSSVDLSNYKKVVSGGVASNKYVTTRLNHVAGNNGLQLVSPPPSLCTDNGVMIAWTGIEHFVAGRFEDPPAADESDDMQYELRPRWPLGEEYSKGRSVARSLKTARVHPSLTSMIQGSLQK